MAVQDAVGKTVCVLALPAVPQPLQDQLPPEVGVGAKTTCAPDATVALAVEVPLMTAPMVVAGQVGGVTTAPYEQYRGVPTLMDGKSEAEHVTGPVRFAYTKVPDLPYATERVPENEQVSPSLPHLV